MTNNELYCLVHSSIKQLTDIVPNVYFRENSSNVFVYFAEIPDEETTLKIETALKEFGTPVPNHCREASFVSFTILR